MINTLSKLASVLVLSCMLFQAIAETKIYVGDLHLGKASSISHLSQTQLTDAKTLTNSKAVTEDGLLTRKLIEKNVSVKLNQHEILHISPNTPYDLILTTYVNIEDARTTDQTKIIDNDVQAPIQKFQRSNWSLYIKNEENSAVLKGFNTNSQSSITITEMPVNYKAFTLTNTGHIVATDGTKIYHMQLMLRGEQIKTKDTWQSMTTDIQLCNGSISQLAISHFGNKIALQCDEETPN